MRKQDPSSDHSTIPCVASSLTRLHSFRRNLGMVEEGESELASEAELDCITGIVNLLSHSQLCLAIETVQIIFDAL